MAAAQGNGKKNRSSLIVIALVVAVVAVSVVAVVVLGAQVSAGRAVVHGSDGTVQELALSQDAAVTVTTDKGTNEVEVKDGRVRVRNADCPNHDCVDQGWIDRVGQQIVCLPHELWVEIVADEGAQGAASSADFDTVGS